MDDLPEGVVRDPDPDPEAAGLPGTVHPPHGDGAAQEPDRGAASGDR